MCHGQSVKTLVHAFVSEEGRESLFQAQANYGIIASSTIFVHYSENKGPNSSFKRLFVFFLVFLPAS